MNPMKNMTMWPFQVSTPAESKQASQRGAKHSSGEARVTYGPRTREIAKQWGITLRERETA
jgi:hypothetical protein